MTASTPLWRSFPFDDPQYVLTVSLDRPRPTAQTHGFATAGWTAMPAAGEIMEQLAGVLNLERREIDPEARVSTVAACSRRVSARLRRCLRKSRRRFPTALESGNDAAPVRASSGGRCSPDGRGKPAGLGPGSR
jgi:hypothetical protein